MTKDKKPSEKAARQRSPNFPSDDLETALDWASTVFEDYKRHEVPESKLHEKWRLKVHGSAGWQRVAALRAFGLVELSGSGKNRKVKVSERAERIIRGAPDREELLREAALSPRIFRELWDKYGSDGLPPDDLIEAYLVWEREPVKFTDAAARIAIANFRKTVGFAKFCPGDIIPGTEADDGDNSSGSNGGSEERPHPPKIKPRARINREAVMAGQAREEVFVVPEGGDVILQFPPNLSAETFTDFKDWLSIIVRKMERLVIVPTDEATE